MIFRRLAGETGQPGLHEYSSCPAETLEIFAEKAGGPAGEAAGLGVRDAAGLGVAGVDGLSAGGGGAEGEPGAEAGGAGPATAPEPAPPHAVTVADAQTSTANPRWRSFRISDICQGKSILTELVTQS